MISGHHPQSNMKVWSHSHERSCKRKMFNLLFHEVYDKKYGRMVIYDKRPLTTKSHDSSITWLREVTRVVKTLYLHFHQSSGQQKLQGGCTRYWANSLKVIFCLITWSHEIMWQIKNLLFPVHSRWWKHSVLWVLECSNFNWH